MKTCSLCGKPTHIYTHPWDANSPVCLPCNERIHQSPPDEYTSIIEVALPNETHLIECASGESAELMNALRLDGVEKFIISYRDDNGPFQYETWVAWWENGLHYQHEILDRGAELEIYLVPPGTIETWG